jgi:hypothetical protein
LQLRCDQPGVGVVSNRWAVAPSTQRWHRPPL